MEYDYKSLLERARKKLPEKVKEHSRFEIPTCQILYEGNTTVIRNFADIADVINREPQHLMASLLKELGTAGNIDGRRAFLKGKIIGRQIESKFKDYVETFVLCSECRKPDTHLEKEGRILLLRCDACGAHRPVTIRTTKTSEAPAVSEGSIYDVIIQDVSRRGDGVVKLDRYTVFVPNTTKGSNVKIKIEKISGNVAFAHVVVE
ncbi:MAG: translation initiation factor IF-2 subunit beta [Thermoplasmatales archaeon]|nr:translation initiation factor IF-2 subunit beta [Thermoplasmatales archaeon]